MRSVFSYDGLFSKYMGLVFDLLVGSLCWLVAAIPIITIGNANYALQQYMAKDNRSFLDFWAAFITHFGKVLALWAIFLGILTLLWTNHTITAYMVAGTSVVGILLQSFYGTIAFLAIIAYTLALLILPRQGWRLRPTLLVALYSASRHLLTSLAIGLIAVLAFVILYLAPVAIIVLPATFTLIVLRLTRRIGIN